MLKEAFDDLLMEGGRRRQRYHHYCVESMGIDLNNILIIKLRYIGDVLLATPVLTALRRQFPAARLTMAVNRGTEDMLKDNPDINDVLVIDRGGLAAEIGFLRDVRRRRFDCVIDLTDGDRSAAMAWASGARVRIGFNDEHRWRGLLYTSVVSTSAVHRVERDLAAVRALGINPKHDKPVLRLTPQEDGDAVSLLQQIGARGGRDSVDRPLVLLHPGARYWFKSWPVERFAELADRLCDQGCRVLVGGATQDRVTAKAIHKQARSAPSLLAGRVSLRQFAAVVKQCALFIGNDTGAMHIAAAVGTPIVALFGPSNPAEWGPRGESVTVLSKNLDCRPCFHPTCTRGEGNCMRQISVDEVCAAASRWLAPKETVGERG